MNEKKIIWLLEQNPDEAISILIELYGRGVHTICRSVLRGFASEDIEEAESDVYIKLWRARNSLKIDETHSLKSYLYAIARNAAIDVFRQKRPDSLPFDDEIEALLIDQANIEDEVADKFIRELLHQVIAGLGEPDCDIFYGKYFLFLKNREIAERLGVSEKKVENVLYRGKNKLKVLLAERGIDGYVR